MAAIMENQAGSTQVSQQGLKGGSHHESVESDKMEICTLDFSKK